jgi:hypothetical protein
VIRGKYDEARKYLNKYEEKIEEKSPEEKWRRDPLGSVIWAVLLIWVGFIFLASNMGWQDATNNFLAQLKFQVAESPLAAPVEQISAWSLIFIGASLILFAEVVIRLLFPAYRRPVLGTAILALILLGIGLNSWVLIWPVVIIVIGLAVVYRGLNRRE